MLLPLIAGSLCSTEPLGLRASRISSPSPGPSPSLVLTFAPLHAAKPHWHLCTVSLPPHIPMPACTLAQALSPRDLCSRRGSALQRHGLSLCSAPEDEAKEWGFRIYVANNNIMLKQNS